MEKLSLNSQIEEQIADQLAREGGPKHKPVPPLETPVIAKRHTAPYQMHRYFARRPWNVFEHIIKHYTNAGDLILDPFCGGGITVYEGLKLRRRVIGIDLNPLATWITKMQVENFDLEEVERAFNQVVEKFEPMAEELYSTTCNDCGEKVAADWFEWSNVLICPGCGREVILAETKKLRGGTYECPNEKCISILVASECQRVDDVLINKKLKCSKCKDVIQSVNEEDKAKELEIEKKFDKIINKEKLFIPKIPFPDGDLEKDHALFKKGIKNFSDFFTKRNLIALARLKKIIAGVAMEDNIREALWFIFSATLRYVNKMTLRNEIWRGNKPFEWAAHAYWLPTSYLEPNIIPNLINRKNAFFKGKNQSSNDLGDFPKHNPSFYCTYAIYTQSSEKTSLTYKSIDCIITDPPFGGNVQYAELSDFWVVWLPEVFGIEGVIDNSREVIETRHQGFPTAKSREHYEDMLYRVFKECHRVLKDNGYMVMTFHNREIGVWMALHRAARRAGFKLPGREEVYNHGMVYQDFIENFKQTFHSRASGSMLGDFILTFKKLESPGNAEKITDKLSLEQQGKLINELKELIEYHAGLDDTAIMNAVVLKLEDMDMIHRLANYDFRSLFKEHFVYLKDHRKWFTPEMVDPESSQLKPIDVIPSEQLVERLIFNFLQEKKFAAMDDLLTMIFTALVNSQRPGTNTVQNVMSRCLIKEKRKGYSRDVYVWKTSVKPPKAMIEDNQLSIFDIKAEDHNTIILKLAKRYIEEGYPVTVGETETRKDEKLRRISTELDSYYLGVSPQSFKILKEIDLLVHKAGNIQKAIEVVTTFSTFNKAINDRFRNLLTVMLNLKFDLEVHIPKSDFDKAVRELNSPANVKDGLNKKVRLIEIT